MQWNKTVPPHIINQGKLSCWYEHHAMTGNQYMDGADPT